ncbi:MAG: hypothetical protein O7D86_11320 [Proteobacteria bacterium]|nr:hypothetical protein [Pseudomonadota bacterium]
MVKITWIMDDDMREPVKIPEIFRPDDNMKAVLSGAFADGAGSDKVAQNRVHEYAKAAEGLRGNETVKAIMNEQGMNAVAGGIRLSKLWVLVISASSRFLVCMTRLTE